MTARFQLSIDKTDGFLNNSVLGVLSFNAAVLFSEI